MIVRWIRTAWNYLFGDARKELQQDLDESMERMYPGEQD